jgi:hypothetical protein
VSSYANFPTKNTSAQLLTASRKRECTKRDAASVIASDDITGSRSKVKMVSTKLPDKIR